jgi:hypothetical protein
MLLVSVSILYSGGFSFSVLLQVNFDAITSKLTTDIVQLKGRVSTAVCCLIFLLNVD